MRLQQLGTLAVVLSLSLIAFAVFAQDTTPDPAAQTMQSAVANVVDQNGASLGIVSFAMTEGKTWVTAQLMGLPPGFHGFHVHSMGSCDANEEGPFGAAMGHIGAESSSHPNHAGDLTSLYVAADGTAYLGLVTDRFTLDDLLDADGSAIMVHADPDNFANIPERYGTPDQETLDTGDSGDRIACGVIQNQSMMMDGMDMAEAAATGTTDTGSTEPTIEPTAAG